MEADREKDVHKTVRKWGLKSIDLWSLVGSNLYGLTQNNYITDSILNPYAGLNLGQSLISGDNTFARQLSQYSKYFGSMESVLQVIEDNPELKEKVKDTLGEIYQKMVETGRDKTSAAKVYANDNNDTQSGGTDHKTKQSGVSSAQISEAYRYQMNSGRRTPTMHAPSTYTPTNFSV